MPNLEKLASQGVTFTAFYANANCSPTRKSAMTGRWWIGGTGDPCASPGKDTPDPAETWIPEALPGHASAILGKWHLGAAPSGKGWECAPIEHGFDYSMALLASNVGACGGSSYTSWVGSSLCEASATIATYQPHAVRDAFVAGWSQAPFPRLAVVSTNLAHAPIHVVPEPHTQPANNQQREKWEKMLAAYDDLIGEMVAAVDLDHTLIIVAGDNGTFGNVAPPGHGARAKGTVFERGVRVPCVIAGKGVMEPGRTSGILGHVVDIWPTAIEMAEGALPAGYAIDGVSLKPTLLAQAQTAHEMVLVGCNWGGDGGERGVATLARKLRQVDEDGDLAIDTEELYDLSQDPTEQTNVIGNPAYAADLSALRAFAISETP